MDTRVIVGRHLLRFVCSLSLLILPFRGAAQETVRTEPYFPDIPGYLTLRCDFHMHTVFSDGNVWPTVRIWEAWRDGLDALAVTDHVEYHPHKGDVSTNRNRSYEIARPMAEDLGLLLIRGTEITRDEPPGHLNALFVTNAQKLVFKEPRDAVRAAAEQGAFLFWNHPGWKQPDGKSVWYEMQGEFLEKGWLRGLEIVNGPYYDPMVHQWAVDKHLTAIGDSDVHDPTDFDYGPATGVPRPLTLVFAKEKTKEALKEALFAGRTAVYCTNAVYGSEQYLQPLFERSLELLTPQFSLRGTGRHLVQIRNRSAVSYELELLQAPDTVSTPKRVRLPSGKTASISIRGASAKTSGTQEVPLAYAVRNLLVAPNRPLQTTFRFAVTFQPTATE